MARARGKYSQSISDRSGAAFPYREMVKEWNGSFVHKTEYEGKHPQLEPSPVAADAQALENARPQEQTVITVTIGRGSDTSFGVSATGSMQPATVAKDLTARLDLGTVTVS